MNNYPETKRNINNMVTADMRLSLAALLKLLSYARYSAFCSWRNGRNPGKEREVLQKQD